MKKENPESQSARAGDQSLILSGGKRELLLSPARMNAAGFLGFSDEARIIRRNPQLGAFVTNAVSLKPRTPAALPRVIEFPGGFLLHTGHPNPGATSVIRSHAKRWERMARPVILHLLALDPREANELVLRFEGVEGVAAVELSLGAANPHSAGELVQAAAAGELPVIANIPLNRPVEIAEIAQAYGAAAISLGAPRGSNLSEDDRLVQGRMIGPGIFPLALKATAEFSEKLGIPLIAAGGVTSPQDELALLIAGAAAVQVDSALWTTQFDQWGLEE
jgi:dihydroorotate dehydrogenase (NAD+) catalytic subunit